MIKRNMCSIRVSKIYGSVKSDLYFGSVWSNLCFGSVRSKGDILKSQKPGTYVVVQEVMEICVEIGNREGMNGVRGIFGCVWIKEDKVYYNY